MSENVHQRIDVDSVVRIAKSYVERAFADDKVANIALEEIRFDDAEDEWRVTIGFSRPWETPRFGIARDLADMHGDVLETRRTYKALRISADGRVLDVSIRTL